MIKPAKIQWSDGSPVSTQFDDVYFSKISGIDETRYVFLQHNELTQRWIDSPQSVFTIAETGFGTGLNLLCTWQQWLEHSETHQALHFVSVEKYPLDKHSLSTALQQWPELQYLSDALISSYPALVPGWHRITLPRLSASSGDVILHLYLGDIADWLGQMTAQVDAWFLDGFTPARNPDMWSAHLFQTMAKLSHYHTSFATFTAASLVRRGLQAAGFKTQKAKGFGKKREMLYGQFNASQGPIAPSWLTYKPWFIPPAIHSENKQAIVVGAGIAGCSSAYSLAKRGWQVTLIDTHENVAAGASGNAQGVLYAKLASDMNIQSEFYLAGYLYSLELLKHVMPDKDNWDDCGVLQLAFNEKELKRQKQFCEKFNLSDVLTSVDEHQASELAGIELENGGLYFKNGAWVYPAAWCEALINQPNIQFLSQHKVTTINQDNFNQWQVDLMHLNTDPLNNEHTKQLTANVVIMCNAHEAKQLSPLTFLPTSPIAGQVSGLASEGIKLNTVLCGDSYVTPSHQGQLNFGATYRLKSTDCETTKDDHTFNLDKLTDNFPSVAIQVNSEGDINGRVSVRCSTPDYVPIAGAVCDEIQFKQQFSDLKKSKRWRFYEAAPFLKGLYLNLGHGSRGLSSAPLCAEFIAAQINDEPWPIIKTHAQMLSPNRFLVSQTIKGL
jgi:tRNA 5-methylaminomethyl-2-thiouridine biosynthesis bifunctional protein